MKPKIKALFYKKILSLYKKVLILKKATKIIFKNFLYTALIVISLSIYLSFDSDQSFRDILAIIALEVVWIFIFSHLAWYAYKGSIKLIREFKSL